MTASPIDAESPRDPDRRRAWIAVAGVLTALGLSVLVAPALLARREAAPPSVVALCGFGQTCKQVGCHFSANPGSPTLSWEIRLDSPDGPLPEFYVPGEELELRLHADDPDAWYIGFELAAVSNCPFAVNGGELVVTEPDRTTIVTDDFELDYLTHSCTCLDLPECCGFVPEVLGSGVLDWGFRWRAPPRGTGPVTFYVAINVANGDGTPQFDLITTRQVDVQEEPCPQRVEDLRLRLATCDPGSPGETRLELYRAGGDPLPDVIRGTTDAAALGDGAGTWPGLGSACRPLDEGVLAFYSVAGTCALGSEGPH